MAGAILNFSLYPYVIIHAFMKDTLLRTTLERLSRGKVFKRQVRVNGNKVPLWVSPDAQLKYLKPGINAFDADLIQIAEKLLTIKSNVWDIGANTGVFTFAASAVATQGTIVSIEADIWLAEILRKSAKLEEHKHKDIRVLPVAVSHEISVASFIVAERGRASNALEAVGGRSQMGGSREKQYVPTMTLDALLTAFPHPDFVKIDVEGAELMALQGGKNLISTVRPVFYMEVGDNVSETVFGIFAQEKYVAFDGKSGKLLTDRCANNTFFIPQENQVAQRIVGMGL